MWASNNLILKGAIKFGKSKDLLGNAKLSPDFVRQLDLLYGVNVDSVQNIFEDYDLTV